MATDNAMDLLADPIREQQHDEQCKSQEHHERLQLETARLSGSRHHLSENTYHKQIRTSQNKCERGAQGSMRGINIDFAKTASNKSDHNQYAPNQKRNRVHIAQDQDVRGKEQGLTESINSRSEHNAQANNEKFDSPLHCADC